MSSSADFFLKKTLGDDFFESLQKFELWKPGTRTTIDHEELRTALKIVPRTIMALLIKELAPMNLGETKEIGLPVLNGGMVRVTKHERDVYSGEILQENKMIVDFKYRAIPGVGLVIMSAFELYNVDSLQKPASVEVDDGLSEKIQRIVNDRMQLHDLIGKVVDKKIMEKDAIEKLVLARLTEALEHDKVKKDISELTQISQTSAPMDDQYFRGMANGMIVADSVVNKTEPKFVEAPKKSRPLKDFLEGRTKKNKKGEFEVKLTKGENVHCPDCGKNIFDGQIFAGCICLGDDMEKKLFIRKTEEGIKVRFSKGWDSENIEMLLEVLRNKRG